MSDTLIWLVVAIVAAGVAWLVSSRMTAERYRRALSWLDGDLRAGRALPRGDEEDLPELQAIRQHIDSSWAPKPEAGDHPDVLPGIARYVRTSVAKPLVQALHARGRGVRSRIQQALDAIEDIEFFAEPQSLHPGLTDLAAALRTVAREYGEEFSVEVDADLPDGPVSCHVDEDAVKDALYLILANGGRYGGKKPLRISLQTGGGVARVLVRDKGPGFSAEALDRATEPFFTTTPGSLGLGLTHARRVVEAHGGEITLRNHADGGGEVEVVLPASARS